MRRMYRALNEKTAGTTKDGRRPGAWAAYAACVLAFLHAAVSFYWAGGGTAGLSTIGGTLEELGRAREPALIAGLWAVGVLKGLAGLLALALVRPAWGRSLPRRPLLAAAWGGAALLTAYGGLFTLGGALVVTGVIPASETADWTALRWHAFLWDPWFLAWGLLLGAAAWHRTRAA